jgi:putative membrane protein
MKKNDIAVQAKPSRSLFKGLVAGLIGGLAGTAAKLLGERAFPPHAPSEPELLSETPVGSELALSPHTPLREPAAPQAAGWVVGGAAGAIYGGLAEFYPAATARRGASFGLVLGTLNEEGALGAVQLVRDPERQTLRERTSEMTSYAVYGVVTEAVRRLVRWVL